MIHRVQKTKNFTVVANGLIRDGRLSPTARFLMILVLMLPDDWAFNQRGLATTSAMSVDKVRTALRELEKHGYVRISRARNDKGQLGASEYEFFEVPDGQQPILEKPTLAKPPIQRTNLQKQHTRKKFQNYQGRKWDYAKLAQMEREYLDKKVAGSDN